MKGGPGLQPAFWSWRPCAFLCSVLLTSAFRALILGGATYHCIPPESLLCAHLALAGSGDSHLTATTLYFCIYSLGSCRALFSIIWKWHLLVGPPDIICQIYLIQRRGNREKSEVGKAKNMLCVLPVSCLGAKLETRGTEGLPLKKSCLLRPPELPSDKCRGTFDCTTPQY